MEEQVTKKKSNMNKAPELNKRKINALNCCDTLPKPGNGRFQVAAEVIRIVHDIVLSVPKQKDSKQLKRFVRNKQDKFVSTSPQFKYYFYIGDEEPTVERSVYTMLVNIKLNDKNWTILDNSKQTQYVVERSSKSNNDLVVAILSRRQAQTKSREWASNIDVLKDALIHKPNQHRGLTRDGICSKYIYFGKRKNPIGTDVLSYTYLQSADKAIIDVIDNGLKKMVHSMEELGKLLFDILIPEEQASYKVFQESMAIPTAFHDDNGVGTQIAVGQNYISPAHTDSDYYYSFLSASAPAQTKSTTTEEILYYFVFPDHMVLVPICMGDIILFNPTKSHCCSNAMLKNAMIYSTYVSNKTVLASVANIIEIGV